MLRKSFLVASMMAVGCGGSPPPDAADPAPASSAQAAAEPEPEPAGSSPGEKCLEVANADIPEPIAIPTDITVSQILVKHREATQAEGSERSREEACLRAQEALSALKEGESFEDVVAKFSESKGAETTGGLIGKVKPGELGDPKLNEAAFALSVNQVSNVVESSFGFHIVLRTR